MKPRVTFDPRARVGRFQSDEMGLSIGKVGILIKRRRQWRWSGVRCRRWTRSWWRHFRRKRKTLNRRQRWTIIYPLTDLQAKDSKEMRIRREKTVKKLEKSAYHFCLLKRFVFKADFLSYIIYYLFFLGLLFPFCSFQSPSHPT